MPSSLPPTFFYFTILNKSTFNHCHHCYCYCCCWCWLQKKTHTHTHIHTPFLKYTLLFWNAFVKCRANFPYSNAQQVQIECWTESYVTSHHSTQPVARWRWDVDLDVGAMIFDRLPLFGDKFSSFAEMNNNLYISPFYEQKNHSSLFCQVCLVPSTFVLSIFIQIFVFVVGVVVISVALVLSLFNWNFLLLIFLPHSFFFFIWKCFSVIFPLKRIFHKKSIAFILCGFFFFL